MKIPEYFLTKMIFKTCKPRNVKSLDKSTYSLNFKITCYFKYHPTRKKLNKSSKGMRKSQNQELKTIPKANKD